MKTRFILFIAAIAGVALSCQKENNVITPEETPAVEISKEVGPNPNFVPTKSMTFVGTTDDEINAETKTSLDGNHIMWAASEGIYLFDGTAPRAFTSTNGSVAATVNFEGNAVDAANYYSVYPSVLQPILLRPRRMLLSPTQRQTRQVMVHFSLKTLEQLSSSRLMHPIPMSARYVLMLLVVRTFLVL